MPGVWEIPRPAFLRPRGAGLSQGSLQVSRQNVGPLRQIPRRHQIGVPRIPGLLRERTDAHYQVGLLRVQ